MARHEITPGPFGLESVSVFYGDIHCDWCGTVHNPSCVNGDSGAAIANFQFGSLLVCECCFEAVEEAVLQWIPTMLPWYDRILKARLAGLLKRQEGLRAVEQGPTGDAMRLDAIERLMRKEVGIGTPLDKINLAVFKGGDLRDALHMLLTRLGETPP